MAMRDVAPHAGAWIETYQPQQNHERSASRPMRARGLKHWFARLTGGPLRVAPHAGAWIETSAFPAHPPVSCRAPCGRVD